MKITTRIIRYCIFIVLLPQVTLAQESIFAQEGSLPELISGTKGSTPLIRFTAGFTDNLTCTDFGVIYFDPKSTTNFDGQLDALKLINSDINVPNFYFITPDKYNLQIYALPPVANSFCKVPLGIQVNRGGDVTIKICDIDSSFANLSISITDMVTGKEQTLLSDNKFEVYLPAGKYDERFFLNISDIKTTVRENRADPDLFNAYYANGVLKTEIDVPDVKNGLLLITNLYGQTISSSKINEPGYHELCHNYKKGIYIITFISDNVKYSKKIFISN
jgi:hypothetical protein